MHQKKLGNGSSVAVMQELEAMIQSEHTRMFIHKKVNIVIRDPLQSPLKVNCK